MEYSFSVPLTVDSNSNRDTTYDEGEHYNDGRSPKDSLNKTKYSL